MDPQFFIKDDQDIELQQRFIIYIPTPHTPPVFLTFYSSILTFNDPEKEVFRTHCGKRRKCW